MRKHLSRSLRATLFALSLSFAVAVMAGADEGMWTIDNFPTERVAETYGVDISADWLGTIQRSTVRLDGGCTGSFASDEGLVLTNNHCTWGCIRNLSSSEKNLSETGFLAASREQELTCPGMRISVLMELEEVTEKLEKATEGLSETAANEERKSELTRLESACEESSEESLSCESVSLYHGGQYFLYKYKRFDDVRLAFAPELAIAAFGGDPDNFNFPRWCLDMSFLRVYEDGKPASTPNFYPWRAAGPDAGEAVFVNGHPGTTERLLTVAELDWKRDSSLPQRIELLAEMRGRMRQWAKSSDEAGRIVSQRILGVENGLKVMRNQLASLQDDEQMALKQTAENELQAAVKADPDLAERYGSAWQEIERATRAYETFADRHRFIERSQGFQGSLFRYARALVRAAEELSKPSEDRLRAYRDTALPALEQRLLAPVPIDDGYETLILSYSLDKMREWLGPDDEVVRKVLGKNSPDDLATTLVSGSKLADPAVRKALWSGGKEALAASDDPMIQLAQSIESEARALLERFENEVEAPSEAGSEKIAKARFAVYGTDVYPDATFTLRSTYGSIGGWAEKGSDVQPFTTLERAYERATGDDPFRLPESWLSARTELPADMRFNQVANTDIVGGNSGSPMVDAQGRLVGLAFDGNIHSIAGSFWFDSDVNRTVAVHPQAMLNALETVYGAEALLEELTISE